MGEGEPPSPTMGVLEQFAFCCTGATIDSLQSGSRIRKPAKKGVNRMKGFIKHGWDPTSFLYVVEITLASVGLCRLEEAVKAWRQSPDDEHPLVEQGTKMSENQTCAYLSYVIEKPDVMAKRTFEIIDGAHRHEALKLIRAEYLAVGDVSDAKKLDPVPVIVLSNTVPKTLTIHVAAQSNNNNSNFIESTNLDNITLFKRSHEVWSEMVKQQIAEIRRIEDSQPLTKKKLSKGEEKNMLTDTAWVNYVTKECTDRNQSLEDVYRLSRRSMIVWIATAKGFSDELVDHLRALYNEDVSIAFLVHC